MSELFWKPASQKRLPATGLESPLARSVSTTPRLQAAPVMASTLADNSSRTLPASGRKREQEIRLFASTRRYDCKRLHLLRKGSRHHKTARKDQTTDHPTSALASPQARRLTSTPDEAPTPLIYAASCAECSDDGQGGVHPIRSRSSYQWVLTLTGPLQHAAVPPNEVSRYQ